MKTALKILLPLLVVAAAGGVAFKFVKSRPEAKRIDRPDTGTLVAIIEASPATSRVKVSAQGTVIPARQVTLQPEVAGRIIEQSPRLIEGGRLTVGETLLKLDARDARLAVEQRQAEVTRAQFELEVEAGRRSVAEREWKLLKRQGRFNQTSGALARREPHQRNAKAAVAAARSALKRARLDVERATLTAPFDALVESESVEQGQLVRVGNAVATLVGTEFFHVQVSLPPEELAWVTLPDLDGQNGARAHVRYRLKGREYTRMGQVERLLGRLDPVGRMVRLVIRVPDPLGVDQETGADAPLLLGAFVDVEIEGPEVPGLYELPRIALREGDQIWTLTEDKTLAIQPVKVIRRRQQTVLINEGLSAGSRIITSRIAAPVPGMALRLPGDKPKGPPGGQAGEGKPKAALGKPDAGDKAL